MADLTESIKTGIAGQESLAPAPAKSTVAADVASQQVAQQKKALLQQAQENQGKLKQQEKGIALSSQLSKDEAQQRENSMLQNVNRQINDLYFKLQGQTKDINNEKQIGEIEQLTFLNNLSNRKWADTVKAEGAKRRLDVDSQMKDALMYANFDDMMYSLNQDLKFKSALMADDRAFNEYLATIEPEAAINAAIQMQKAEASAAAVKGAVKGVTEGVQQVAASGYFADKNKQTNT
jgi:hypothetical protein